ncbi:MAG: hypothetical protein FJY19_00950 [Bacteroidetes bacterium]|nr:hypothetical protein [Bacteroidota bacterium]
MNRLIINYLEKCGLKITYQIKGVP